MDRQSDSGSEKVSDDRNPIEPERGPPPDLLEMFRTGEERRHRAIAVRRRAEATIGFAFLAAASVVLALWWLAAGTSSVQTVSTHYARSGPDRQKGPIVAKADPVPARAVPPPPLPLAARRSTADPMSARVRDTGSVVQLGAFRTRARAEQAWTTMSARFASVRTLRKLIIPYPGGYRLRAAGSSSGDSERACEAVKSAGDNCFVIPR